MRHAVPFPLGSVQGGGPATSWVAVRLATMARMAQSGSCHAGLVAPLVPLVHTPPPPKGVDLGTPGLKEAPCPPPPLNGRPPPGVRAPLREVRCGGRHIPGRLHRHPARRPGPSWGPITSLAFFKCLTKNQNTDSFSRFVKFCTTLLWSLIADGFSFF